MKISKIEHKQKNPSFKTYFGLEMQKRILIAKTRNLFSREQLTNLYDIESDKNNFVLDLTDKYIIKKLQNKKGMFLVKKVLTLKNNSAKLDIADISHVFESGLFKGKTVFHINKFLELFNDDFNLRQKINEATEKLSKIA